MPINVHGLTPTGHRVVSELNGAELLTMYDVFGLELYGVANPIITYKSLGGYHLATGLWGNSPANCNFGHPHVLDVSIGAAIVSKLSTDYAAAMAINTLSGPLLQKLIPLSGISRPCATKRLMFTDIL